MNGVALRPRSYVAVRGPDAEEFLQRMVSNDVSQDVCEALLLTAKARVIAPLVVWRRADDDFLLLTEPELGDVVLRHLMRLRLRAQVEIEPEQHTSHVVLGDGYGIPTNDYGTPAAEVLDEPLAPTLEASELERLRVLAGTPRWGREIDERILPAEAGLEERAISFTKGCYPGQEPIARLHYRGHANRELRVLEIEGNELPAYDAELSYEGKAVGRVTSAVRDGDRIAALAYVRREVPEDAELEAGDATARALDSMTTRP
jgi:tRNA-modifying protein YgfZ